MKPSATISIGVEVKSEKPVKFSKEAKETLQELGDLISKVVDTEIERCTGQKPTTVKASMREEGPTENSEKDPLGMPDFLKSDDGWGDAYLKLKKFRDDLKDAITNIEKDKNSMKDFSLEDIISSQRKNGLDNLSEKLVKDGNIWHEKVMKEKRDKMNKNPDFFSTDGKTMTLHKGRKKKYTKLDMLSFASYILATSGSLTFKPLKDFLKEWKVSL